MSDQNVELSVVVAAYNEESVIASNLKRIVDVLNERSGARWELVCVNDGSSDRTGTLMDKFAGSDCRIRIVHHRRNFGQGRALRTAFDICRGDIIVTLDADLSYGPEYIYLLSDALKKENVEIAVASPYMKGGTVRNVPFYRLFLSRIGNSYLARMMDYRIATSTCVVRAYRREVLDYLVLTSDGMELQLEVLMKASAARFRVCEVPAKLEWTEEKVVESDVRRVSKMRILQTIRMYLFMGWLSRPASFFILVSLVLIALGLYMGVILSCMTVAAIMRHMAEGMIVAISSGLREVFSNFTYSFVFCGTFLLVGIQIFAFALLFLQNKLYFEELCRVQQLTTGRRKPDCSRVTTKTPTE